MSVSNLSPSKKPRNNMKKQTLGTLASLLILTCQPATNATAAGMPSPLKIGDRVQTSESTPVWTAPPIGGALSGTQPPKATGSIVEGPVRSGDVWISIPVAMVGLRRGKSEHRTGMPPLRAWRQLPPEHLNPSRIRLFRCSPEAAPL